MGWVIERVNCNKLRLFEGLSGCISNDVEEINQAKQTGRRYEFDKKQGNVTVKLFLEASLANRPYRQVRLTYDEERIKVEEDSSLKFSSLRKVGRKSPTLYVRYRD